MHSFYREDLYKYLVLNDTYFYLSLLGEKEEFVEVRIKVIGIDTIPLSSNLPQENIILCTFSK